MIMRSQSAMEYLMTYGWAILVIAVILGVLFQLGVFGSASLAPKAKAGQCQVQILGSGSSTTHQLAGLCSPELPQYVAQLSGTGAVTATVPSSLTPSTGYTVTLWFERTWSTNDGVTHGIFSVGGGCGFPGSSGGSCDYNTIEIFKYQTNQWYFRTWSPNGPNCDINIPDSSISGSVWHQITFEDVSGSQLSVWIDDGTPTTCSQSSTVTAWQTSNMYIGEGYGPSSLIGSIANLQLYNTTLSTAEVQALYQEGIGGAPIRPQNLVGWWPLNGNFNDYSGDNDNGQGASVGFSGAWSSTYSGPA